MIRKYQIHYDKEHTIKKPTYYAYSQTCVICGDTFMSNPTAKYCSSRCANDAYIIKRKVKSEIKRAQAKYCAVCHLPVEQSGCKIKKYCSNACKQKAYRQGERG